MAQSLDFTLLDVFAAEPFAGNSLTVFPLESALPTAVLQKITCEMRQFESIFVWRGHDPITFSVRIFTMEEELDFAGHPIIGAAVYAHRHHFGGVAEVDLLIQTAQKKVSVTSRHHEGKWRAEMDQGIAQFLRPLERSAWPPLLAALNLTIDDLATGLAPQVVSTGLPYLIVPITSGIERSAITVRDFEPMLARIGAKFVFVLDVKRHEGRTWDNDGRIEDSATGTAAGPAAAFLVKHGLCEKNAPILLNQGRFVGRPSTLIATVYGEDQLGVRVAGQVIPMGHGTLDLPDITPAAT
ncbi:MAG TPA: PhzF family phenazine biosynthesis protein [Burkholderiaceae bacterium]|jgi:PhzF family phenazine biosynthesis protein